MNHQFARLKKLVGLTAMATLLTTAGWSLAPVTAHADPGCLTRCDHHDHDGNFDRDRHFFDDHRDFFDHDRDFFFDHDRDFFHPFFPFFIGR